LGSDMSVWHTPFLHRGHRPKLPSMVFFLEKQDPSSPITQPPTLRRWYGAQVNTPPPTLAFDFFSLKPLHLILCVRSRLPVTPPIPHFLCRVWIFSAPPLPLLTTSSFIQRCLCKQITPPQACRIFCHPYLSSRVFIRTGC